MARLLSAIAVAMLLTGGFMSTAHATGTNSIAEISGGVRMVGETIRSTDIMGTVGWIALAFIGVFVGLIGLGFWFGSQQIAESIGWSAIGFYGEEGREMDAPRGLPLESGVVRPVLILGAERMPAGLELCETHTPHLGVFSL